jgi:hypothetical protein
MACSIPKFFGMLQAVTAGSIVLSISTIRPKLRHFADELRKERNEYCNYYK